MTCECKEKNPVNYWPGEMVFRIGRKVEVLSSCLHVMFCSPCSSLPPLLNVFFFKSSE